MHQDREKTKFNFAGFLENKEKQKKKMKVLELFAGTRSIGKAFEAKGHEVFSIDWDKSFDNIDLCADIMTVFANDILQKFGRPDVIWASFDCTTFSIAAISHHRQKNPETGNLDPVSDYAKLCDAIDQHVLRLILALSPKYWFIENPRGGLRKMTWMEGLPRYTVTYCQYELDKPADQRRMKPTDIWTNHPNPEFKPMCKNGDPCHASAPRGAKTGTQGLRGSKERSVIPEALCNHIVYICEKQTKAEYLEIEAYLAKMRRLSEDCSTDDIVEVVRCNKCKYQRTCSILWESAEPKEKGYCSLGEREDNAR